MSTEKIHGPSLPQQQALQRFQQLHGESRSHAADSSPEATTREVSGRGEKLEISEQARHVQDLRAAVDAGRAALAEIPETREAAVAAARRHLAAGALDTAEARDVTAGRLSRVLTRLHRLLD